MPRPTTKPTIVLIGMMGAGKTSVGRKLAELTGRNFIDVDDSIERCSGLSPAQLFARDGEAAFRAREASAIAAIADENRGGLVVATGGGVVLDPANRAPLRAMGRVYWLRASTAELRRRVGDDPKRPLAPDLEHLADARRDLYNATAHVIIDTGRSSADEVANHLSQRVPVLTGEAGYDVTVGYGTLTAFDAGVAAIVARTVLERHGARLADATRTARTVIEIPDGEDAKTVAVLADLWDQLAEARLSRSDVIVGVGGGAATDVAGFAAATYLRGIGWTAVSTTVLGMVDAAIGGKTAIDLGHGKNLVGAVWQPQAVICDTAFLDTLPEREIRSGWAEIVKYGFIADPSILALSASNAGVPSDDLIRRCVAIKAAVVSEDPFERGRRAVLNYGHTFGHALETAAKGALSHGEAVSIGMVAAAALGHAAGCADVRGETTEVLGALGLPQHAPEGLDRRAVEAALRRDKKRAAGGGLRFVLLERVGEPILVSEADLPVGAVDHALAAVLA